MIETGEPIFLSNLLLYPLIGDDKENGFSVLDELEGEVAISELSEARVDRIMIENNSDRPLVMIDGEEVVGAFQNRVVAASSVLKPGSKSEILTTCVEKGRWHGASTFNTGRTCSFPTIRAIIAEATIRKRSAQDKVWSRIDRKLKSTKTISKTSSMHDIYENLRDDLNRYVSEVEGIDANGMLVTCGRRILGLDYFSSHNLFDKFKEKLIRSYGLEAIDITGPTRMKKVEPFIKSVFNGDGKWKKTKGGGHGSLDALLNKRLVARRLSYRRKMIHLSAFPVG